MPLVLLLALGGVCGALTPILAGQRKSLPTNKPAAAGLIAGGVAAMDRGDSLAAKTFFRRALVADPKNLAARTYLGILADQAGELEEAKRQFAAAVSGAPDSPEARNNYGAILLKLRRKQEAAGQFETSLRLDPKQPGALVNLAQIRYATGSPENLRAARQLFERARSLAPDAETARALVVIALRLHEPAAAAAEFPDYSARLDTAPESVAAPAARAELGAALLEAGLAKEAAVELDAVVKADLSNLEEILLLARAYHENKDDEAAGRTLESALARGMESAPLFAALAEIYESSGQIDKAIPAMRRAIQLDPKSEALRFRYAMLLTSANAPQAAVIRLREALDDFPSSSKLWFALGVAQFTDNKNNLAADAFSRALEHDPKMSPALAYLGMISDDEGRMTDAIAYYQKAIGVEEPSAVNHYLLAESFTKLTPANIDQAQEHLKRALELDPGFLQARLALGKLYLRANRLQDAAGELESVVKADAKVAEAYYQLSRVYTRLKRREDAQAAATRFEQLSSEQKQQSENERREIVRRLAEVRY
ncbi:MAG: tetratricopeptide repeat protein [Acidipila sp.]|nr:tetratricopeptide repeat protein [Acidipila sp.]